MPIGPARMPLFDHLGELRMRLVRIVACLAVAVIVFYMATPTMGQFLLMPIAEFLPVNPANGMASLQAIDPFEAFAVRFQISVWAGIVATSPVILWQLLAFFLPALKPSERKWFIPTFAAAVALFIFGTVFCYCIILNPAFQWLTDQAMGLGYVAPRMSSYIDIIIKFELGFGLSCSTWLSSTLSPIRSCAAAGGRCTWCSWSSAPWSPPTPRRSLCCSCSRP